VKCIGHDRLCVCLSVPCRIPALLHGPGCNLGGMVGGCPLVVHCWADVQSVHGLRSCDNIVWNAKCQRVLVLALCLVSSIVLCTSTSYSCHENAISGMYTEGDI